ncbi:MAG: cell division protein ZapB [Spirochaetaceae bacterium]|jgi:hypothetical protein|nr:cell division protein ZapB [Spirochaetaceae bacterium]
MVNLEQIKLLESKVAKAIEHLQRLTRENSLLREQEAGLKKRIDELDAELKHYKENQSRIEAGIVSALERLDQFEDTMVTLAGKKAEPRPAGPAEEAGVQAVRSADPVRPARHPEESPAAPVQNEGPPQSQIHGKKGSMLRPPGEAPSEEEDAAPRTDQLDIF